MNHDSIKKSLPEIVTPTLVKIGEFAVSDLYAPVTTTEGETMSRLEVMQAQEAAEYGTQAVFPNHNGHLSAEAHAHNAAIRESDPYGARMGEHILAVMALRPPEDLHR